MSSTQPNKGASNLSIFSHAVDLEWKLFERQEKQVQQLTALCLSLISLYPSLYRLAFSGEWNSWQCFSVICAELSLTVGLLYALQVFRLKSLVSQDPEGLRKTVENNQYWDSQNLERDRALVLSNFAVSLAQRRKYAAKMQRKIMHGVLAAVFFVLQSFLAGFIG